MTEHTLENSPGASSSSSSTFSSAHSSTHTGTPDYLEALKRKHRLPSSYIDAVDHWLMPVAEDIADLVNDKKQFASADQNKPHAEPAPAFVVAIQGAQGTGKSTCAEFLKHIFLHEHQLNAAVLSLDDFYLTRAERKELAQQVHPLFSTRGVPGTHDIDLALKTLRELKQFKHQVIIPRFNKAMDDRWESDRWTLVDRPVDIVLIEGWCLGLHAQTSEQLQTAVNDLEAFHDSDGIWRNHINECLADQYQALFNQFDRLLVLQAPSFQSVYQWRLEQEQKLIASRRGESSRQVTRTLTPEQLKDFVSHYERLTRHGLDTLPDQAHWCLYLNKNHQFSRRSKKPEDLQYLIFTDLDGTLLDHHTYSWRPAAKALALAHQRQVPVMLNTSKTLDEVLALRRTLENQDPFVIENGAAFFLPEILSANLMRYFGTQLQNHNPELVKLDNQRLQKIEFGIPRADILNHLKLLKDRYGWLFEGFSQWSIAELQEHTGLSQEAAKMAANRAYSEPILWQDSDAAYRSFSIEINALGLQLLKGGRFIHVQGKHTKATPLSDLVHNLAGNRQCKIVALGDNENDRAMLSVADVAVCIKSPVAKPLEFEHHTGKLIYSKEEGPAGWAEVVNKLLS